MNRLMHLFLILLRTTSKSHHEREIAFSHQLNTSVVLSQASNRAANKAAEICPHPSPSPFTSPVLFHSCHHPCASPSCQDHCQTTTKFVMTTDSIQVAAISWRMPLDDWDRNGVLLELTYDFPSTGRSSDNPCTVIFWTFTPQDVKTDLSLSNACFPKSSNRITAGAFTN